MSYADTVFKETIQLILEKGVSDESMEVRPHWEDGTPAHTIAVFGVVNRYDLQKEFPILTLRRSYWKSAWDEVSWIWQKKSNQIADLHSTVWDEWADEQGTIGKAYGYQMGQKYVHHKIRDVKNGMEDLSGYPSAEVIPGENNTADVLLDQVDGVIYDIQNNPASRRIITNMYVHKDLHEMALYPCAYSMTFNVAGNKLNAMLNQRSQDMVTANNWNVIQASMIVYAMASAYGYEPGELIHVIGNCHIYDRHIEIAKELCQKEGFDAPKLKVDPSVKSFYDFTGKSFSLVGEYKYHEFHHEIPIAI